MHIPTVEVSLLRSEPSPATLASRSSSLHYVISQSLLVGAELFGQDDVWLVGRDVQNDLRDLQARLAQVLVETHGCPSELCICRLRVVNRRKSFRCSYIR